MDIIILKIASEFSRTPGARYENEGKFSGESFRKNLLSPRLRGAIKAGKQLVVNLDGTAGYGTSFLEEAFGGLIRENISLEDIKKYLKIISSEDPSYIDEIKEYIDDAAKNLQS